MYDALVVTGTSGAGKTTLAQELCRGTMGFALVPAVTTRKPRGDDAEGHYAYVDCADFLKLRNGDDLLVDTQYRGEYYGIQRAACRAVRANGRTPVLVITPEAASGITLDDPFEEAEFQPFVVFMDAEDTVLDDRVRRRRAEENDLIRAQREIDRSFGDCGMYTVRAGSAEAARHLVTALWKTRDRSGILPKSLIRKLLACGTLLEHAREENVEGASYDLRLGDEYYHKGRMHRLSEREPILNIEPYDSAIVTSHELADFPRDVSGRFDLAISLFCQGVILSNGPQVDAGFRGPLFCLLFNTSSSPVLLKRRQHYATIEFHKVLWPTERYRGHYQAKTLLDYLPANAAPGAIHELQLELEKMRKEAKSLQTTAWAVLSLILAMIAVFVSFR